MDLIKHGESEQPTIETPTAFSSLEFAVLSANDKNKRQKQFQMFNKFLSQFQSFNFPNPKAAKMELESFLNKFIEELDNLTPLNNGPLTFKFQHFGDFLELNWKFGTDQAGLQAIQSNVIQYIGPSSTTSSQPVPSLPKLLGHYQIVPKVEIQMNPTVVEPHQVSITVLFRTRQFF